MEPRLGGTGFEFFALAALFQNDDDFESVDDTGRFSMFVNDGALVLFTVADVVAFDTFNVGGMLFTGCNIV